MSRELLTQEQARRAARELNETRPAGFPVAVATTVPAGAWGGTEDGWTVGYRMPEDGK